MQSDKGKPHWKKPTMRKGNAWMHGLSENRKATPALPSWLKGLLETFAIFGSIIGSLIWMGVVALYDLGGWIWLGGQIAILVALVKACGGRVESDTGSYAADAIIGAAIIKTMTSDRSEKKEKQ